MIYKGVSYTGFRDRVTELHAALTPEAKRDGERWYKLALMEATRLALAYDVPVRVAAGVIAALSPRKTWAQNLKLAEDCLARKKVGSTWALVRTAETVRDWPDSPPLSTLKGPKVRAFYEAIMGDTNAVVVDVWMLRALGFDGIPMTRKRYQWVATKFAHYAWQLGSRPAELQAQIWCHVRGRST